MTCLYMHKVSRTGFSNLHKEPSAYRRECQVPFFRDVVMDSRLLKVILSGDVRSLNALLAEDPLVLNRAELATTSETPLHMAALAGKTELVKEIIAMKPSLARELNQDGFTPLHIASAMGNLDIVRALLSLSPDLCMLKDKGGRTPLHHAAIKGRAEIVEELLSRYPQALQERTARGETALHLAVMNSQFDVVKLLIEKAGSGDAYELIKAEDDDGNSILQLAVASKQLQILDYLKSLNILDKGTVEVLSGDQLEGQTNAAPKASQPEKGAVKTDSMQQSAQSADNDSSSSIWSEVESMVLVVASLIATVTYQAGLSPPQTIWNNNSKLDESCTSHSSFFSSTNLCPVASYYLFMSFNTSGFFSSVFLMFSFAKPSYVQVLLPVALLSMVITYMTLSVTMAPNGISLLVIYVITLAIFIYCILAVEVVKQIFRNAFSFAAGKVSDARKAIAEKRKPSPANASKMSA